MASKTVREAIEMEEKDKLDDEIEEKVKRLFTIPLSGGPHLHPSTVKSVVRELMYEVKDLKKENQYLKKKIETIESNKD